jgi:hypothetical protein
MAALAMVALMSLISAGCGSTAPSETGTASRTSTGGNKSATDQDKAVKFAECIRSNGVSDFPDPDAKGEFQYGVSVSPAVWQKAVDTCKDLQPPGSLSAKRSPKQQTASLRFAQCIRKNGVKDFPDPANGEPVIDTTHIPSSNRPGGMTILNAAIQKCRSVMGEAVSGR